MNYIEVGYEWGDENAVSVIPVVPSGDGLIMVRPVPGKRPPQHLLHAAAFESDASLWRLTHRGVALLTTYFAGVCHHFLGLLAAVIYVRAFKRLTSALERRALHVIRWPLRVVQRAEEAKRLDHILYKPGPNDLIFSPAYWHDVDPSTYRTLQSRGAKLIILIHDILPITFSDYYHSPWREAFKARVAWAIQEADGLCSISGATKQSILQFAEASRLPAPHVMIALNGYEPLTPADVVADLEQHRVARGDLVRRFRRAPLLMVGSIEPKKGHIRTIEALESLWSDGFDRDLILIGRRGWMEQPIIDRIRSSSFYGKRLFWYDNIDDVDLAYAYINCHALVFSSIGEGFGVPLIEAASYGRPAIVYDTPIAREVLRGTGIYFSDSQASLKAGILSMEEEDEYRRACDATAEVSWPTWREYTPRVFDHLLAVIRGGILPEAA